jgi:hypothetical protein
MRPSFYNDNINRDYPFLHEQTGGLPDYAIADFGCIMGAESGYRAGVDTVNLSRIRSVGGYVEYEFTTTAPGLEGKVLRFVRAVSDEDYITDYAESIDENTDSTIDCSINCESCNPTPDEDCANDNPWTGYLVTGKVAKLAQWLPECTPIDCEEGSRVVCVFTGTVPVEPSLIQSLSGSYARSLNVANADRTRASAPQECKDYCWPFDIQDHYTACACVIGNIRFVEGYNACISQSDLDNTITINACVGGGAGEPCTPPLVTDDEAPPEGRQTLDGALKCDEVIRTINGVGDRFFEIVGGTGVVITPVPEENKVIVDINLQTLALCADIREQSSLVSESSSIGDCDCGPV